MMTELMQKKLNDGREYRKMTLAASDGDDEYIVEGYASTFDEPYELMRRGDEIVEEVVERNAFDNCDMSDVIMQYDHEGRVFARTRNKTLTITPDDHGLYIRADLSGTEIGRQLWQEIKGGYIDRMSFGFVVDGASTEDRLEDGMTIYTRRISAIRKLYDVSAVSFPANDGTEISARNLCDGVLAEAEAERRKLNERRMLELKLKLMEV